MHLLTYLPLLQLRKLRQEKNEKSVSIAVRKNYLNQLPCPMPYPYRYPYQKPISYLHCFLLSPVVWMMQEDAAGKIATSEGTQMYDAANSQRYFHVQSGL